MRNITFSADEDLIELARQVARAEHKTLNVAFREWLAGYAARKGNVQKHRALMERLKHINPGGPGRRKVKPLRCPPVK